MANGKYQATAAIKAGAMLPETLALLAQWDATQSHAANLDKALRENWLGKASRRRAEALLAVFRQRYLADPQILEGLLLLNGAPLPRRVVETALYFHTLQADALLHDVAADVLYPLHLDRRDVVTIEQVARAIAGWVAEGRAGGTWSEETIRRASQGVLTALRDFGLLSGARRSLSRRLVRPPLPIEAFAYVAFWLRKSEPNSERLVGHPEWRLFLLDRAAVERLLSEAHQERLLYYQAAGSTVRIDFSTEDPRGFIRALVDRATRAA